MKPIRPVAMSALLLSLTAAFVPLVGQTPTKLEQIPIYPGALRQPALEVEAAESLPPPTPGANAIVSRTARIYRVNAGLEDVVRFYQQRLRAQELRTDQDRERKMAEGEHLPVGQATSVSLDAVAANLSLSRFEEEAMHGGNPEQLAAATRAAYVRTRTPFRPGEWLYSAGFDWDSKPSASEEHHFTVDLSDTEEFEIREPSYHNETQIEIGVQVWRPAAAEAPPPERPPPPPMAAPPESQLGVPLYPGARFDGQMSAALSASDQEGNYYVYTSTATPQQVTTFYQTRTGKKGLTNEGGTLIAVKGEGLFPELGVTIQPNVGTYPPSVKTMLTIRKKRAR